MTVKSKFKYWTVLIVGLLLLNSTLLVLVTTRVFANSFSSINGSVIFFYLVFSFCWIWLLFGELRTKALKVKIGNGEIKICNYMGLGSKKIYRLEEFQGFETMILPSKYDKYEYLYLIKDGKRVVKLSEFYHINYLDLKAQLSEKLPFLGQQKLNWWTEIKEIFN